MLPSLYNLKAILILNNNGQRVIARYYDEHFLTIKEQKEFEKVLFSKTSKSLASDHADVIMVDSLSAVFRSKIDLYFYVIGSTVENEIILMSVLNCLFESVNEVLRKNVEKRVMLENLDFCMLIVDEICDNGIILEIDSSQVIQRVCFKQEDNLPYSEQTVVDLLKSMLK